MKEFLKQLKEDLTKLASEHRKRLPLAVMVALLLGIFWFSHSQEETTHIYRIQGTPDFKDARILGSQGDSLYEGKERLITKNLRDLMATQVSLRDQNEKLLARMEVLEKGKLPQANPSPIPESSETPKSPGAGDKPSTDQQPGVHVGDSTETSEPQHFDHDSIGQTSPSGAGTRKNGGSSHLKQAVSQGPTILSFPVKEVVVEKSESIVLPAGSFVKAKLMTGVEAPEGKTFPVLLQLDYAYIIPNQKRLDLAGCFMIAKSQGDLSTERVQMQASKLSCVSKEGKLIEREVNGFVADDKDNSFAVIGSVNSKQDRVAATAFLSSVVEGIGKGIQQAQTVNQVNPLGGSQSVVTGDQAAYLAGGGASNAASMVTQWYLKQAQNLLPTINVGSGLDVWIVMQDTVRLPNDYFRKTMRGEGNENIYTYFSRIVD